MYYNAVIFDSDGVLTKPTLLEVQREAVRRAFDKLDVKPTTETVDGVISDGLTRLRRVCTVHGVSVDDFWSRYEIHATTTQRACLENGTKPLYDDVVVPDDIDHPSAVVSDNQHATVEHILDVSDIDDRFEVVYGHDPAAGGTRVEEPDPHCIERAMGEPGADSAPYVDDSNVDVVAADRADIDSAFIRRPHRDGYQLTAEPTHELDSLDELLAMC